MSETGAQSFYQVGGAVLLDAPSYVVRKADGELFAALSQREFCYVLDSRQIGKSSLMLRTAARLRESGVAAAVLDLTALGQNLSPEQWYAGLLRQLAKELLQAGLDLENALFQFWRADPDIGPLQRWIQALRETVLRSLAKDLVIFVDEIDAVRSLRFPADEFFAAIRECYNRRARDPELARLTFCLLGVATPSDLIQEARTTPFNIGRRIEITDFTEREALPLAEGLGRNRFAASELLSRIIYWTGGHPYLTQVLCRAIAKDSGVTHPGGVDRHCKELFLSARAREKDDNLLFVSKRMLMGSDRASVLNLYETVRRGKRVRDDETNSLISHLRLAGITRIVEGYLRVRNRIYFRVFDRDWINANMPDAEVRRQRAAFRRGVFRASAVATLLIVGVFGGIWYYADTRVLDHVAYYKEFGKHYGIYFGIGKLEPWQVGRRNLSFRFTKKGRLGPLLRMEAVDGKGRPTPRNGVGTYLRYAQEDLRAERECQWELVLDNEQRVVYEKARDRAGRLVWVFVYSPQNDSAERSSSSKEPGTWPRNVRGHYVGWDGYPAAQRGSSAEYVDIKYDQYGNEELRLYKDRRGEPMPGLDGAYGQRRQYDKNGLCIENASVDADGHFCVDQAGNCGWKAKYDNADQTEGSYFNEKHEVTHTKSGYAQWTAKYDVVGNRIEEVYLDEAGKLTCQKDGYAGLSAKYDELGNEVEVEYFNEAHKPTHSVNGYAGWTAKYDGDGNQTAFAYFDEAGKPTPGKNGYAGWTAKYDDGNRTELAYFDEAGKPTRHKDGYAGWTAKYDRGDQIELAYFDEAGKPTHHKDGYAGWTAKYNNRDNQTELAYFNESRQSTLSRNQYAGWTTKYDDRGNWINRTFFDEAHNPVRGSDGVAQTSATYDDRGNQTELDCFDEAGKPTRSSFGAAQIREKYDPQGNRTETAYYDEAGNPIRNKDGYATLRVKYDQWGNRSETVCYDEGGRPLRCKDGYASWRGKYDERGDQIEMACFDEAGKPTRYKDGYGSSKTKYDEWGNEIQTAYFDEADKPLRCKDGYASRRGKYDERGNQIEMAYFDEAGTRTRHKNGYFGWSAKYDPRGNQIDIVYLDETGRPMANNEGLAQFHSRYDERSNRIETDFFDQAGKPVRVQDGCACWRAKFDERGNQTEILYLDETGQPVCNRDGVAQISAKYDKHGHIIEEVYFDEAARPTRHKDGYAGWTAKYDELSQTTEQTFFGYDPDFFGFAKRTLSAKDGHGQVELFDEGDNPLDPGPSVIGISRISPNSLAARIGLQTGDIIWNYDKWLFFDGTKTLYANWNDAVKALIEDVKSPGDTMRQLVVIRRGKLIGFRTVPGTLGVELIDILVTRNWLTGAGQKTLVSPP